MSSSQIFQYGRDGLLWDSAKGCLGLFLVGVPLVFGEPVPWLAYTLYGLAGIFLLFLGRLILRQFSQIELTDDGLFVHGPISKSLNWDGLDKMKLRYYSTKKSGDNGWMYLQLNAGGNRINLDSQCNGFDQILEKAAQVAADKQLPLDPVSIDNLNASGINTPIDRVGL